MPDRLERRRSAWEGAGTRGTVAPKRRLTSRDLLGGRDEVIIEHAGRSTTLLIDEAGRNFKGSVSYRF